jgi:hypothetical protein
MRDLTSSYLRSEHAPVCGLYSGACQVKPQQPRHISVAIHEFLHERLTEISLTWCFAKYELGHQAKLCKSLIARAAIWGKGLTGLRRLS